MKKASLFLILSFFSSFIFAREFSSNSAEKLVPGSEKIVLDDESGAIKYIKLKKDKKISIDKKVAWLNSLLNISNAEKFELYKTETDQLGFTHYSYKQTIHGIAVEDGVFYIHTKNGYIVSANGEYYPNIQLKSVSATISSTNAIQIAKNTIKENTGKWNENITAPPVKVVVYNGNKGYNLAYKTDVYSQKPLIRKFIYVDAFTGTIVKEKNRIHEADVVGTAVTKYNGTKAITTDSYGGTFRLRETGRGTGINTFDLNTSSDYGAAIDFTDADNYWNTTTNQDNAAYDAHFGSEATYDYYLTNFGRNSYDNSGAQINSYVHFDVGYVNAFWDGSQMTYGDGDGVNYSALTSIDVVGHEITHAVTENTASLVYMNESGALNESFSDIFGIAIDFYNNPSTANYLMGEQFALTGVPFRSMSNPNAYGDPDTYNGTNWYVGSLDNGGVHTNSGVQNYWFYLLTNGGSGTNDIGNPFSVSGIGMTAASAIAYRNLTTYLTPNSQYSDARYYAIQSAIDLYGSCSAEEIATTNAWYAVGVGNLYSNAVISAFTSDLNYSCTTPSTITFTNNSTNGSSYIWDFGDGNTSTSTNPSHTYTAPGSYTVSLITSGSASCGSQDTLIQPNFITITNSGGPIAATCLPTTTGASTYGMGIFNLTFSSINNSSNGGIEGYQDYTCSNSTTITEGMMYPINITTGTSYNENVRAWIDYNNDGQFNMTNELVFVSDNIMQNHAGTIIIPSGSILNTPLRMRIASDYYGNTITSSCSNVTYGQYEDYAVTIIPNTNPPSVDFIANNTVINVGETVNFTDLTQNIPTSWNWTFSGSTTPTSNQQAPSATYNTLGSFPVKLVATNAFGTDSLSKTAYINVVNQYNMCGSSDSTTVTSGILYDSGGSTGNYSNNENCSFLINPGCAIDITLSFTSFYSPTSTDYMRVYDGTDASGTLLGSYNTTSTPPASITATSGSMYITWYSNSSTVYSGWEATWSSTTPTSAPTSNFSMSDNNPPLNTPVDFTDLSTNYPGSWVWDFGDGNSSTTQHPTHVYTTAGAYTVQLITNNCYESDTVAYSITVQDAPIINVTPNPFLAGVSCGDSITIPLDIYNTGSGDLVYDIEGSNSFGNGTIELLALTYGTDMGTEYPNTISAINQYYTNYNLTETNTTSASVLQTALVGKNIFLIPEQESSNAAVFSGFATVLQDFVANGGVVIFCGGGSLSGSEIFNTGLFSGSYGGVLNSGGLNLVNPTHELADSISLPTNAVNATFYYNFTNPDAVKILDYIGNSVVSYREIGEGKVIYVGFDYYSTDNNASRFIANAVKWAGSNSLANWLTLSQNTDTVIVSDTSTISVTLDASNLYAGTYNDTIVINSNDLSNNPLLVPITFTVAGQPLISISPTNIDFGTLQVGASTTDTVYIYNNGCDTLDVTSFLSTNSSFTVSSGGFQIPPYSNDTIILTFSPDTIKTYNDTIFINNNDTLSYVLVNGVGIGAPIISYNPTTITETIFSCNDSITIPITVYNTGQGTLYTSIDIEETTSNGGTYFYDGFENGSISNWTTSGGNFSVTSSNPAQGNYCLQNTTASAHFNGVNSSFTPNTTNYLSVKMKTTNSTNANTYFVVGDANIVNSGDIIFHYAYQGNWRLYANSSFEINTPANINQWYHFEFKNINYITHTFDYYIDGNLIQANFPFRNNSNDISKIHLYNLQTGIAYYDDIQVGSALVPQWITSSTDTLNVNVADSSTFNVTLYANGLNSGTYNTNIILSSNDPLSPLDTIPVSFTVDGSPEIALSDTCLNFGSIMENTSLSDSLTIFNNGCDTLFVTNVTSGNTVYTAATTYLMVLPGDSATIDVTFSPTSVGSFSSFLTIYNNDSDTTICLNGTSTSAPIISVNPTSLNVSLSACEDSITLPFTIYNTGGSSLEFDIDGSGSASGTIEVLALTYGVDMTTEYPNTIAAINQYFTNYNLTPINTTVPTTLQAALVGKDVLLIPEIESGSAATFSNFATILQSFVSNGGSVIFCGTDNAGAHIYNTGLMTGTGGVNAYSGTMNVINNTHNITSGFPSTIPGQNATYTNNITNSDAVTLVEYSGYDVVSYRPFGSGKVIFIAYDYFNYDNYAAQIIANSISWTGSGAIASWMDLSQYSDTITPSDSTIINVTFYSDGLNGGVYYSDISINSNDPLNPQILLPCTLNISFDPCASFTYDIPNSCSGQVNFTDGTINTPTSWTWNFGDGNTSNLQNPTHIYTSPGNYYVQLIACNATSCDTVYETINITNINGPISAYCTPSTISAGSVGMGIYNFTFASINNSTNGGTDGYQDYSCTASTNVTEGSTYAVNITTGTSYNEDVIVWIDFNNDGQFNLTNELVFSSDNIMQNHSGNITIPNGSLLNTPLRMRVASDYYANNITSSCTDVTYGQYEDYSIIIQSNTQPPNTNYTYSILDQCQGVVQFTDVSTNFPTSWLWNFGDGTTSTYQNPFHTYTVAGYYTVQLITTNAYGSDTTQQSILINSLNASFTFVPAPPNQATQFVSTSNGAISWSWDFGDGYSASLANPLHVYADTGCYAVTLNVMNGASCSSSITNQVCISTNVNINEINSTNISIAPNPSSGEFTIKLNDNHVIDHILVYDKLGKVVLSESKINSSNYQFNLSNEAKGIYLIQVYFGKEAIIRKIILH
ncbi:MAG: PKD domain-containing protein [Flavobacteriales bacterium]|nr:PKD domain-containing protein [Flavobacteriales bacterium]MCB9364550.1 PKD domain-containing protein [Flavobacteriales bacterium]